MKNLIIFLYFLYLFLVLKNKYRKIVLSIKFPWKGPVYKVTFYSDGTGVFNYIKNTKKRKDYFKYSTADLDEIILYSEKIKFSEIGNKYYNSGLQDLQIKTIVIKEHSVKYNENPPEELRELYNKISIILPVEY